MSDEQALFSLVSGEGDGAILGLAAGDSAGGAWELGYSAHTEQAVVVAYDLIEHGRLEASRARDAIRELDGVDEESPVYRAESSQFREWLNHARLGVARPSNTPCLDHGPRSVPIGVFDRKKPQRLIGEVVALGAIFHDDAESVLCGGVFAAAAAASCFGQSGKDFVAGVAEATESLLGAMDRAKLGGISRLEGAADEVRQMIDLVGITDGAGALEATKADPFPGPWDVTKAALLISAPLPERDHIPIEQAARLGGSALGASVGGVMGARAGIRAWPWAFANDTWFAEIGRRLVRGPAEVADLPIPYAVEHHLMSGERQGFH